MLKKIIPKEMQQTMAIGAIVFLALLFLGGRVLYSNSVTKMTKYKKQIKRVKLENKVGVQLVELKKAKESMSVIRESSKFLAEIAKLSGQLNLKLKAISAEPAEKFNEYVQLSVSLQLDTTFHELGLFVSVLENSELLITVKDLIINDAGQEKPEKGPKRVDATLVVSTVSLTDTILEK